MRLRARAREMDSWRALTIGSPSLSRFSITISWRVMRRLFSSWNQRHAQSSVAMTKNASSVVHASLNDTDVSTAAMPAGPAPASDMISGRAAASAPHASNPITTTLASARVSETTDSIPSRRLKPAAGLTFDHLNEMDLNDTAPRVCAMPAAMAAAATAANSGSSAPTVPSTAPRAAPSSAPGPACSASAKAAVETCN